MPQPPTPRDAVSVLRKNFRGFDPTYDATADDSEMYGDPAGGLALNALRSSRAGELGDRLRVDEASLAIPTEGYVQGEPGRRTRSHRSALFNAILGRGRLQDLSADAAADPFTGQAERARVRGVQDALDEAATTRRPELTDASNAVASRNAFAQFLQKQAGYQAETSDVGREALDAASRRKVAELTANASGRLGMQPQIKDTPQGLVSIDRQTGISSPVTDEAGNRVIGHSLNASAMQKAADASTSLGILDALAFDFPNVQGRFTGMGPVSSKVSDFRNAFPLIPADRDWARFTSNTATLKNQTIKAITGAQMSQGEAERIMAQLPTENLKPEVWQERAAATRRNIQGLLRRIDLLQRGVPASQLDQVPLDLLGDDYAQQQ